MRPKLEEGQLLLLTKKHLIFVSRFLVIPRTSLLSFQSDSLHYAGGLMSSAHLIPYPEEPDGCTRLAFPSEPEFPVK